MSGTPQGIDVSSWQHPAGRAIDWPAVAKAGVAFALVKATQGASYTSPYALEDIRGARAAGLLVGAYHFATPSPAGDLQAGHFLSAIAGEVLELGAWIDWELGAIADWQATAIYTGMHSAIEEVRPGVGLYCDLDWHATFVRLSLPIARLWLADPSADAPPPGCVLWQRWPKEVPGIEGECDTDELVSRRDINLTRPVPVAPVPVAPVPPVALVDRVEHAAEVALHRADAALAAEHAEGLLADPPVAPGPT